MKFGILGGSFNPVHLGHLLLAQEAKEMLGLERVFFIPYSQPPHKSADGLLQSSHRLEMIRLAIRGNPSFEASDIEMKRGGVSYSVDTLRHLRKEFPSASFYFLIGSDAFQGLYAWKEAEELFRLCRFVIAERPRFPLKDLPPQILRLPMPQLDISSKDIRQRLEEGKSIQYLVPEPVRDYLEKKRLYLPGG